MAEGVAAVNQTSDSTLSSLNEVGKIFGQFFGLLLPIMGWFAAKNTSKGKSQVDIHPITMMAFVFMVALFYLVLVLATMLQFQTQNLVPFMMVILLLGSVVVSLALMMISPTIAGIYLGLWFFIFALMCYKNRNELYEMIPQRIKILIEGKTQSGNSEITAVEGNFQSRENLNV